MTAIVEIVTGKSENVLRVPNDAIRFKPTADSPLAEKLKVSQGAAAGGPRSGPDMVQLKASLGLDETQTGEIESELKAVFADMRAQFQGQGAGEGNVDRSAMREQMRQKIAAIFEKHLTAEQFKLYQQDRRLAAETRAGQVWVQSEQGEINPVNVRFGISDDNFTQIISRDLKAGDKVVTRIRSVKQ
jgi:HlyD family secretion protein